MNNKIWLSSLCCITFFLVLPLSAMDNGKPVVAVHLNVLSENAPTSRIILQALEIKNIAKILGAQPKNLVSLMLNAPAIGKKAEEFSKTTKGATHIINKLSDYLAQEYKISLSPTSREIFLDLAVNPHPNQPIVTLLKQLKAEQYITLGISDQDIIEYELYCKKMAQQGVNVDELFNAVITLYADDAKDMPLLSKNTSSLWITHAYYPSAQSLTNIQHIASVLQPMPENVAQPIYIVDHHTQAPLALKEYPDIQHIKYQPSAGNIETVTKKIMNY